MHVHLFRADGRVFAVTERDDAANLPAGLGDWTAFKALDLTRGTPQPGLDVDECLDDLERHGFHITDAHVRITDRFV